MDFTGGGKTVCGDDKYQEMSSFTRQLRVMIGDNYLLVSNK